MSHNKTLGLVLLTALTCGLVIRLARSSGPPPDPPWVRLEIDSGGFIPHNDDDYDNDGTQDLSDTGPITNEDDLVQIRLIRGGTSTANVTLQFSKAQGSNTGIRLWTNSNKTGEVTTPTWTPDNAPSVLYVEGFSPSTGAWDAWFTLSWGTAQPSTVYITVPHVNMTIYDGQQGGYVTEDREYDRPTTATDEEYGALTVANLNDSDGDERADVDDSVVREGSTVLTAAAAQGATTITVRDLTNDPNDDIIAYQQGNKIAIATPGNSLGEVLTVQSIGTVEGDNEKKTITVAEQDGLSRAYAANSTVYHRGHDEADLMKLELQRPNVNAGGVATLSGIGGSVKVWAKSTKETEITLPATYDPGSMDPTVTLWVEATAVSSGIRDIKLQWEYQGHKDRVMATAAWAQKTTHSPEEGTSSPLKKAAFS